jgi:sterol desaturase/sphingolipid hydroxylase (fatty acid hydroxylase superfamily)
VALNLARAAQALGPPTVVFIVLALLVKRAKLFADARRAFAETRFNLFLYVLDVVIVAPFIVVVTSLLTDVFQGLGIALIDTGTWTTFPPIVVGFVAVLAGDFIGYWRHRLEHSALLWPAHAIHHSDTEMTWLALFRFHPINRLSTHAIDLSFLLALGLPPYALLVNVAVRHYYGMFIHADLPWTYGPLGRVFVSPAMHRWHHAMDSRAFNTNYATVFSFIDRLFGTYRVPGPCTVPLGVADLRERGIVDQIAYPFRPSSYRFRPLEWIARGRRRFTG